MPCVLEPVWNKAEGGVEKEGMILSASGPTDLWLSGNEKGKGPPRCAQWVLPRVLPEAPWSLGSILSQGASHVAPVKSGVHAHGEGERVIALESW